jgi:membrane-associated phospholipid phosphatase
MPALHYRHFLIAALISSIIGLYLISASFLIGKDAFFLALNTDLGPVADSFFHYWTYMGDGAVWVVVIVLVYIYQKKCMPLVVAAIIISTLITQFTKNYIYPSEPRPTYGLIDMQKIHTVSGVELLKVNSFPSGHTGTAFTVFLIGCLLIRGRWFIIIGLCYAVLVGYSRIYLAQHFPLDVGAGIFTGVITVFLSIGIYKKWSRRYGQIPVGS